MKMGWYRRSEKRVRIQTHPVGGQKMITRALSLTQVAPTAHGPQIAVKQSAEAGSPDPRYHMAAGPYLDSPGGVLQLERF